MPVIHQKKIKNVSLDSHLESLCLGFHIMKIQSGILDILDIFH